MISVQPVFDVLSRITPAGHAKAYGKKVRWVVTTS
jgi:hypothetical protein